MDRRASAAELDIPLAVFDRENERTIPVKEAAFRLKKSEDTIRRWLRSGRLQGWQMGGSGCAILVCEDSVTGQLLRSLGRGGPVIRRFLPGASTGQKQEAPSERRERHELVRKG